MAQPGAHEGAARVNDKVAGGVALGKNGVLHVQGWATALDVTPRRWEGPQYPRPIAPGHGESTRSPDGRLSSPSRPCGCG
jgi:hypothetical protein